MEEKDRLTKYDYDNYENINGAVVDNINQALLTHSEYEYTLCEDTFLSPAEVEQLKKENEKLKEEIKSKDNLIIDLDNIRKDKNNPFKPKFYIDENIKNKYVFCARRPDDDSNMSLICFEDNGELCGYASENYDTWNKGITPIKEINFLDWAYDFIRPLIKVKASQNKLAIEKLEYLSKFIKEKGFAGCDNNGSYNVSDIIKTMTAELKGEKDDTENR